jgi:hypothetical protein
LSYLIYYLVPTAIMMVAFISWVITRSTKARTGTDTTVLLLLLIMMVTMLVGPAYLYFTTLNLTLGDIAIWEIAVFMSVGMMPIGVLLFAQYMMMGDPDRRGPLPLSNLLRHLTSIRAAYILLLLGSELLMGWTFDLASGLVTLSEGYTLAAVGQELSYSITTYWFVFTMVGEMALTLLAFRKTIRRDLLTVLGLQTIVMFLTPTALSSQSWETYSLYLDAAVMTGVIVLAIRYLRVRKTRDAALWNYLGLFIVANAIMMGGFLWWLVSGVTALLALSLVIQTLIYFDAVLTGAGLGTTFLVESVVNPGPESLTQPPTSRVLPIS